MMEWLTSHFPSFTIKDRGIFVGFHHKLQPHHHVAVWAISALLVVLSAAVYANTAINSTLATEPSKETKEFFGFDEKGEETRYQFQTPQECLVPDEKMQKLSTEIQSLYDQLNTLSKTDTSQMSKEELAAHQQKIEDLQNQANQRQEELNKLAAGFASGPSSECKKALVQQMLTMMEKMQPEMKSKFLGTLSKVDTAIAKVEVVLPKLEEAGVEQAKIDKIKAHIKTVKDNVAVLRSFFLKMIEFMNSWVAAAKADPLKAFDQMQGGGPVDETQAAAAAKAADTMVATFQELIKIFDGLVASQQDQGGN